MKATPRLFLTLLALAGLTIGAWAQTEMARNDGPAKASAPAVPANTPPPPGPPVTAADIQELKDALAAQQKEIQALQEQLKRKDQALQQAQGTASGAAAKDDGVEAQTGQLTSEVASLKTVNTLAPSTPASTASGNAGIVAQDLAPSTATQEAPETYNKAMEGPLTIHFRGINITPGGYAAAEFVRRSRALGADMATPFNSVTMPGAAQSQISEFFGSGRQSKITTFVDGRLGGIDLSSYVSADFLSAGVTSNSNQTNSYTLRLRQAWAQAKFSNGWSFLGGQTWTLLTENGKGIAPDDDLGRTNDARPKTIDSTYSVGFVYARQYGVRLTKAFGDTVAIAVSVENPQATLTTHNNAGNYLLGEAGASNSYNTTANYSFNPSPDIIAKVAFDPGFGHYEIFGVLDRFSDRIYPCVENFASVGCGSLTAPSAALAYNSSKQGGGFGASARWNFTKHITFALKGFGGDGIGRYGPAGISDASINPDGSVHLIKNLMGLSTLEFHVNKKLDIYSYAGVEYGSRAYGFDPLSGKFVGYGSPTFVNTGCYSETPPTTSTTNGTAGFDPGALANCTADSRAVTEGTLGFWYRFYSGPRGSFRFGTQYSYVTRQTWSGVGFAGPGQPGASPSGIDNMVFTSFRYYLP